MKINYFNRSLIERCSDNHLRYLLSFRTSSGRSSFSEGVIRFFNRGTAQEFAAAVLDYQTQFVRDNLLFLEVAIPNRNAYGNLVPGYIQDTVFLSVSGGAA